ncbi:MAG TPA: PKD domain-containing protein, partial [Anaeromyxobacteraceae bacterium]|nr:PKD domain-containing protein [Anaeromyxobacteraceae bacterium]
MRRPAPILLLSLAASACTCLEVPAPMVTSVEPAVAPTDADTALVVRGANFLPAVKADLDDPGRSRVSWAFALELVGPSGERVALAGPTLVSEAEIDATLPAGAPATTYDLHLVDPGGGVAILIRAIRVYSPNRAPLARLAVTPLAAATGSPVAFDASASGDAEDPKTSLSAEFDFEGNGTFSAAQPVTQAATHAYAVPGVRQAWVRVTDSGGLASYATVQVVAAQAADMTAVVTTGIDEADAGATPADPKGAGFSLREAVTWANAQATPQVITFAGPMAVVMTAVLPVQRSLRLAAPGMAVVGRPGVSVDFGGHGEACLQLAAPDQRLLGLAVRGCTGAFVELLPASRAAQVAYCDIGPGATAVGVEAAAISPPGSPPASLIGPGNLFTGLGTGVRLSGTDSEVIGNRIRASATGIEVLGVRTRVSRNAIFDQVASGLQDGTGLRISSGAGPVEVWHNIFDQNAGAGVGADAVPLDVRNNLFTRNGRHGIEAPAGDFAPGALGWNGFWGNALGTVPPPLATGPTDVLDDPLYVDRPAWN